MKNIADEIRQFLDETGLKQSTLASASGVSASIICRIVKGTRRGVLYQNSDALRAAMKQLRPRKKKQPVTEKEA